MVLIWALDQLSSKGVEDTLSALRQLYQRGADVWSHEESWLVTSSPEMRELLVSLFAWVDGQDSARRSARIRAGLERPTQRRAAGRRQEAGQPGPRAAPTGRLRRPRRARAPGARRGE